MSEKHWVEWEDENGQRVRQEFSTEELAGNLRNSIHLPARLIAFGKAHHLYGSETFIIERNTLTED